MSVRDSSLVVRLRRRLKQRFPGLFREAVWGELDIPGEGSGLPDAPEMEVAGWAHSTADAIDRVEVLLDATLLGEIPYGQARPDIASRYTWIPESCGFSGHVPLPPATGVDASLVVRVTDRQGNLKELERALAAAGGTLVVSIDTPAEGARIVGDEVQLNGWAYSSAGAVSRVEVLVDGQPLGEIPSRLPRPDVLETHPDAGSPRVGFSGLVKVSPGKRFLLVRVTGPDGRTSDHGRNLKVVAGASRALAVEATPPPPASPVSAPVSAAATPSTPAAPPPSVARPVTRVEPVSEAAVRPSPRETFFFSLDNPRADSVSAGSLLVDGWTFHTARAIDRVEVLVDGQLVGRVRHGLHRPDVFAEHPVASARRSGFWGLVTLPDTRPGPASVTVRAVDARGQVESTTVEIRIATPGEPLVQVEQARWGGDELLLEGFAIWPRGTPPCHARVFHEGRFLGETRVNLSRPDLAAGFPTLPAAVRSGFRLAVPFPPPTESSPTAQPVPAELTIELVDADGRILTQRAHVKHQRTPTRLGGDVADLVADLLTRVERDLGTSPSLLVHALGIDLTAALPGRMVFAPPSLPPGAPLPYLDGSVDLVLVPEGDLAALAEARRVATHAVYSVRGAAGRRHLACEWQRADAGSAPTPSVSIVIPVYGKVDYTEACLSTVVATLPDDFRGEVLVIDDASPDETPERLARWVERDARIRFLRNDQNLGFLATCNRGAREATGEVLVFLNNDTLPRPGWLPPLVRTLVERSDAGAVGGKLLYPDGTLQEAGGVIFSDGSGCNFGRMDVEADHPLYTHVRDVDYCSGALLATPRELFLSLGGFDERFRPAYYEDTDYCFSVRAAGRRVYYQPESAIVHFEGISSGTDLASGVKAYQNVNREKFVEKWAEALKRQPSHPSRIDRDTLYALSVRGGGDA